MCSHALYCSWAALFGGGRQAGARTPMNQTTAYGTPYMVSMVCLFFSLLGRVSAKWSWERKAAGVQREERGLVEPFFTCTRVFRCLGEREGGSFGLLEVLDSPLYASRPRPPPPPPYRLTIAAAGARFSCQPCMFLFETLMASILGGGRAGQAKGTHICT